MHIFRGRCATTWPFETNHVFELAWFSLKGGLKGKDGLGPWKTSTALRWEGNLLQVHLHVSYCLLLLIDNSGEAMRLKGPRLIPFWCLMPKGEKIRSKQEMDQLPLENFENSRVRVFVLSKYSYWLFFVKSWLLVRRSVDFGKRGVFEILNQFLLEWLSLCLNMCVWLRDRNLSLICKNKPSGGKEWSIYAKNESKQFWVLICIDVALPLVVFYCVGINHQKGGDWKGNVPLGHL